MDGFAAGTISRRLTSITKAHEAAGYENSPASTRHFVVGEVLKGVRRTIGVAQKAKDPLLVSDVRRIVAACPRSLLGCRDRALVLVGFAGAFRRSELAAISVKDVAQSRHGMVINVPVSKTDQERAGREMAIPWAIAGEPARCARCASGRRPLRLKAAQYSAVSTGTETSPRTN